MKKMLIVLTALAVNILPAEAAVRVAAALPDLGSIASYIGGEKVEVFSIAKNNSNPHSVEVLPSYMIKVSRAAIYLKAGLSLDQWSEAIIEGSRNSKLQVVDCSDGVSVLQKPAGKVDASMGDVHPDGNPHYWLDPSNSLVIAGNITEALKKADSANSQFYQKNYDSFRGEAQRRIKDLKSKMTKLSGSKIISYHSSWVYFAFAFNLNIAGNVELLPGIPPTGKHLAELVNIIKENNVSVLLQEPYFSDEGPRFLARLSGIKVYKFSPSCDDIAADSYFKHFDEMVGQLTGSVKSFMKDEEETD